MSASASVAEVRVEGRVGQRLYGDCMGCMSPLGDSWVKPLTKIKIMGSREAHFRKRLISLTLGVMAVRSLDQTLIRLFL